MKNRETNIPFTRASWKTHRDQSRCQTRCNRAASLRLPASGRECCGGMGTRMCCGQGERSWGSGSSEDELGFCRCELTVFWWGCGAALRAESGGAWVVAGSSLAQPCSCSAKGSSPHACLLHPPAALHPACQHLSHPHLLFSGQVLGLSPKCRRCGGTWRCLQGRAPAGMLCCRCP